MRIEDIKVGIEVGILKKKKIKRVGIVSSIEPNPKHPEKIMCLTLKGKPNSYYCLNSVYEVKLN